MMSTSSFCPASPVRRLSRAAHGAILVLLVVSGCGPSIKLQSEWGDPAFTTGPLRNMVVLIIRDQEMNRRIWEDTFVQELAANGVRATPSYSIWPESFPDTMTVRTTLREGGYDGVLVSLKTDKRTESYYVPGSTTLVQTSGWWDYYGRYRTTYEEVSTPGYTETTTIRDFRTDIWAAARPGEAHGKMVWTGMTQSEDPPAAAEHARIFAEEVIRAARAKGVF